MTNKMKGQMVQNLIGLMVALIVLIAVAHPVLVGAVAGLVSTTSLSGTSLVIANMIPMLLLVSAIVLVTFLFQSQ